MMNDKDWGYVLNCERQTHRQSVNFLHSHSSSIQQAGGKIETENLFFI